MTAITYYSSTSTPVVPSCYEPLPQVRGLSSRLQATQRPFEEINTIDHPLLIRIHPTRAPHRKDLPTQFEISQAFAAETRCPLQHEWGLPLFGKRRQMADGQPPRRVRSIRSATMLRLLILICRASY